MITMKDYRDLYFKVDVLLLACVLESIFFFQLEPVNCLCTPGCSRVAMLNFTDVNLKLISGIEKFQFTGSTVRGHISMICKGCTETNNKRFKFYNLANLYHVSYT